MRSTLRTLKVTQILAAAAMILALIPHAWGGTQYKILHNFGSGSDGSLPSGPLLSGGTGNLYGVTANGGGLGAAAPAAAPFLSLRSRLTESGKS